MKSLRFGTFETNSSSMHCLTVANELNSWSFYANYVKKELAKFKQKDGSYYIKLDVDERNMDGECFELRRFVPHTSFVDKAFYLLGTIDEHYSRFLGDYVETGYSSIPYDSTWYLNWSKKEKDLKKKEEYENLYKKSHEEFLRKKEEYISKYAKINGQVVKNFHKALNDLIEHLELTLGEYLCERPQKKNESFENYRKVFPKVKVEISTYDDEEMNVPFISKDSFGLGCYDNSEFYATVAKDSSTAVQWLINPYSAVLAGSDEMPTYEQYLQEEKAEKLLEEAWEHAYAYDTHWPDLTDKEIEEEVEEHCYTWNDDPKAQAALQKEKENFRKFLKENKGKPKMPKGKMIWPIGG